MLSQESIRELNTSWLPNVSDTGLNRLIELLEKGSPLLIHGSFTRALPMGCLATHIAWSHPKTCHMTLDAGICWLNGVAGLNPATSHVIREWDRCSDYDFEVRCELLTFFTKEREARQHAKKTPNRIAELVNV